MESLNCIDLICSLGNMKPLFDKGHQLIYFTPRNKTSIYLTFRVTNVARKENYFTEKNVILDIEH